MQEFSETIYLKWTVWGPAHGKGSVPPCDHTVAILRCTGFHIGLKINAMVYTNWQCFLVMWKIVCILDALKYGCYFACIVFLAIGPPLPFWEVTRVGMCPICLS